MGPEPEAVPAVAATSAVLTDAAASRSGVEEDLDGVAMVDDEAGNLEVVKVRCYFGERPPRWPCG